MIQYMLYTGGEFRVYSKEEFDNAKTRILKYIIFKKRTENEVRMKFQKDFDENLLEDIIQYLKEAKYIDDMDYIQKAVNNFKILKNLSIKETKYKLLAKGLNKNLIENYIYENMDELEEYEINSASKIITKKKKDSEDNTIKAFLLKKGYKQENINQAFKNYVEFNI